MMRSILLGLDDSPFRPAVIELGIRWAKRFDAGLVGLGVIDRPRISRPEPVPPGGGAFKVEADRQRLTDARQQIESWLDEFRTRVAEAGVPGKAIEATGDPEQQIRLTSHSHDVILLGHRTYFRFETQKGPCNTLEEVLHNAPRPVVTVPESLPATDTVMLAYDGSLQAARTVQQFVYSGLGDGVDVHVVTIAEDQDEAKAKAERAVEFLSHHGIKARCDAFAQKGSPANMLLGQAERINAGLMVLGAYGRTTLHDFFLGSVTKKILHAATVPLFLYH